MFSIVMMPLKFLAYDQVWTSADFLTDSIVLKGDYSPNPKLNNLKFYQTLPKEQKV